MWACKRNDLGKPPTSHSEASRRTGTDPSASCSSSFPASLRQDDLGAPRPAVARAVRASTLVRKRAFTEAARSDVALNTSLASTGQLAASPSVDEHSRLMAVAEDCISAAWADSTKRTYEQSLRVWVGGAELSLEPSLLLSIQMRNLSWCSPAWMDRVGAPSS